MYQKNDTQKQPLYLDFIQEVDRFFRHFHLVCIYKDFSNDIHHLYQIKIHL